MALSASAITFFAVLTICEEVTLWANFALDAFAIINKKDPVEWVFTALAEGLVDQLAGSTWTLATETGLKSFKSLVDGVYKLRIFKASILKAETLRGPKACLRWIFKVHQCNEVDSLMELDHIVKLGEHLVSHGAKGRLVIDHQIFSSFELNTVRKG